MITKASFQDFKGLRHVEVPLDRFTVIVGPNSSGKSSILEGIHYCTQLLYKRPEDVFSGPRSLNYIRRQGDFVGPTLLLESDAGSVRYGCGEKGQLFEGKLTQEGEWTRFETLRDREQLLLRFGMGGTVYLRLDSNQLSSPSYSEEQVPRMEFDGEGLPSVLVDMKLNDSARFAEYLELVRQIVPAVRDIRFVRKRIARQESQIISVGEKQVPVPIDRDYWGHALEFDMSTGGGVSGHLLSEGTLLVLGIIAFLKQQRPPRVLLLDDIDRALHPQAQVNLVTLLKQLLQRNSDLQIVATSHSPYLLDALSPAEVRLTYLNQEGEVLCGALTHHPEFDRWKDVMSTGEMWSMVGEDWLAGSAQESAA